MATVSLGKKNSDNGLRPLRPSKDLLGVANLIEEAFSGELDRAGWAALREMRWMGRWGVFLLWLDFLSPDVNTYLNGFVWADHGKIVGNATVSRGSGSSSRWFISNVAVAKSHRRQGLARQLMEAAIDFVQEMHGKSVSLQVKQGNAPAVHLYQSMGFKYITATTYFHMARVGRVSPEPIPSGLKIREHNLDVQDAYSAYNLARAAMPVHLQMEQPIHQSRFRLGSDITLSNFLRGMVGLGKQKHWVIEERPGVFVAMLSVQPGLFNTEHKLSFYIHPAWWGKLEKLVISLALSYLKTCPKRPIAFKHSAEHEPAIQALKEFGFKVERTHMLMKLTL